MSFLRFLIIFVDFWTGFWLFLNSEVFCDRSRLWSVILASVLVKKNAQPVQSLLTSDLIWNGIKFEIDKFWSHLVARNYFKNREQRRKISITTKTQFATIARSVASRICVPNKTDYDYPGTLSLIKSRIRDVRTSASLYTALFTQIMSQAGLANNKNFLVLAEMNFWFCEMNLGQVGWDRPGIIQTWLCIWQIQFHIIVNISKIKIYLSWKFMFYQFKFILWCSWRTSKIEFCRKYT